MESQELVQTDEGIQDEKTQQVALPVDGLELLVALANQPPLEHRPLSSNAGSCTAHVVHPP